MGIILSHFSSRVNGDATVPDLNLDLENATPTQEESDLYGHVSELLRPVNDLLDSLRHYEGCGDLIRKAISNPTSDNEEEAWQAVQPAVVKLKQYFEYSASLEDAYPKLLKILCEGNVRKNIEQYQALTKLLAEILDFAFEFDYLKMKTPSIQNDFSYYRRTLSRGKLANETDLKTAMIEDELANRISLFYAYPTPMLKTVTDVTALFVNKNNLGRSVSECLSILAAACYHAVTKKRTQRNDFFLRVMVVSIILYDHIDPQGAFNKQSPINIKSSVKAIQTHGINECSNLMSALRFNTKHLNDETTPKNIKQLLKRDTEVGWTCLLTPFSLIYCRNFYYIFTGFPNLFTINDVVYITGS
ncbi:protein FAM49B-like [Rhizophagus clarus]|uniref:Protein FAM49B-like n=1 Tax=Rhizophagus clarus TaxID=94130 RepID=A0A8H3LJD5_9GLOM|nr:protein FAM49B-like [Rhizophagus clarus]